MLNFFTSLLGEQSGEGSNELNSDIFFMMFGQSNTHGNTGGQDPSIEMQTVNQNVLNDFGGVFSPLEYGVNNLGDIPATNPQVKFAVEIPLGYYWSQNYTKDLYISKKALGSTGLYARPNNLDWNVSTNELIVDLRQGVNRLKSIAVTKPNPKLVVYSCNGETDAANLKHAEFYQNSIDIYNEIEAIWGSSIDLILITKLNEATQDVYPLNGVLGVRDAQQQLADNLSNCEIVEDMNIYTRLPDGRHYAANVQEDLGLKTFNKIINKFN